MSRWDEYDKMQERYYEKTRYESDKKFSDDDIKSKAAWADKKIEVLHSIDSGQTSSNEWILSEAGWVDFHSGSFSGRQFSEHNERKALDIQFNIKRTKSFKTFFSMLINKILN